MVEILLEEMEVLKRIIVELEAERDAAVKDLSESSDRCHFCKSNGSTERGLCTVPCDRWQWRGVQNETN